MIWNIIFPDSTITNINYLKLKAPTWTPTQLRDAINSVVTQELRFTQASIQYNIPKGTLYDNILGKSNRMQILDEAGLTEDDEMTILEFCCDISTSPYNRRTKKPLSKILEYMLESMSLKFPQDTRFGFRWWWAFCKKYSISSLYYGNNNSDVWIHAVQCCRLHLWYFYRWTLHFFFFTWIRAVMITSRYCFSV